MPRQMRQMFSYILIFGEVANPLKLWTTHRHYLMEDFLRRNLPEEEAEMRALLKIQSTLIVNGHRLSDFGLLEPNYEPDLINDPINIIVQEEIGQEMQQQLNADQRVAFDVVMTAVNDDNERQRYFFVTGAAGTGKTYLF